MRACVHSRARVCVCGGGGAQLITTVEILLQVWTVMFQKTFLSAFLDSTSFVPLPVLSKCVQWGTDVYKWCESPAHMQHNTRTCYNNINIKKRTQMKKSLSLELLQTVAVLVTFTQRPSNPPTHTHIKISPPFLGFSEA